ncbi:MAG: metallophosphoesterase [Candidatus Omnitrophota bacterium]|jgi:putative phosphoesterase|nr:MAG: metallophosphoesterase [Candidatus Omnitrophota bacterium]
MTEKKKITTIGVLSDTHLPDASPLPLKLLGELEKVDVIIHLGDFCDLQSYKDLQKIAPVLAVNGNMDSPELKSLLPEKKTIEIEGFNLGLVHGWGPAKNLENRVAKVFTDVDLILFGHSHQPLFTRIEDVFVFNPGSPSMNVDGSGTYGILELGETITHRIIRLD